jgi:hypothetical protein
MWSQCGLGERDLVALIICNWHPASGSVRLPIFHFCGFHIVEILCDRAYVNCAWPATILTDRCQAIHSNIPYVGLCLLSQCSATGVAPRGIRRAVIFYKITIFGRYSQEKAIPYLLLLEFIIHSHTGLSLIVSSSMWYDLFSYVCILIIGQGFICRYVHLVVCGFAHPCFMRRNYVVCRHVSLTN